MGAGSVYNLFGILGVLKAAASATVYSLAHHAHVCVSESRVLGLEGGFVFGVCVRLVVNLRVIG
ncbi:MAG: hypothetical protein QW429_06900, partial [Thermoprotei archaeon]